MYNRYSFNENSNFTFWIDLDNSPHVPFFATIIKGLMEMGYNVKLSARNYSQTVSLANLYNFDYKAIGKHHGKHKTIKLLGLFYRAFQLLPFAIKNKPTLALSHGSRAQMIVAAILKIPIVMFLDYEYIQTIPFVKPKYIFLPNVISKKRLKKIGAKIVGYPGIKEDIYISNFKKDPNALKSFNFADDEILVVARPPAHEAHYHNPESEKLFDEIILFITENPKTRTIIIPRDDKQKKLIKDKYKRFFEIGKLIIPDQVLEGLNLMWHSDLVISGGGTMNREATVLGVPVYSIFRGKIGDVDKYLSKTGKLVLIENILDIKEKIKLQKRIKKITKRDLENNVLKIILSDLDLLIKKKKIYSQTKK